MPRLTARFLVVLSVVQWALTLTVPTSTTIFAGSTVTAVLPVPDVSNTAAALYPDESQVDSPGPTVTGDEAFALQTAAAFAPLDSVSPLVRPQPADAQEDGFDVMQHWGNLAPAQSVKTFGLDNASPLAPKGCQITQIHVLNRHGARYPTEDSGVADWGNKVLAAANSTGFNATGKMSFLQNWSFKLGAEILTPFGREQMYKLGVTLRTNYGQLLDGFPKLPVIRTTSEDRMVESAQTFAQGFYGRNSQDSYHLLLMAETGTLNNTLAPWLNCPNANNDINDLGFDNQALWAPIYLKETLPRLQSMVTGIKLDIDDLLSMQDLCAYETVALGFSEFCDLFTETEWKGYAYYTDISFVYSNGYGNPASSAQGIGYVQELVSRLEQKAISKFQSSVNSTIVTNPDLFPLDQPIYVDFTHDTAMSVIYAAMNFTSLARDAPIPLTHIPANRAWKTNELAPFGSSMIGQVMTCGNNTGPSHIRFLINDAAMPLTGIVGCPDDKDGLCPFSTFVAGMNQRIAEVDWDNDCTANYTIPSDTIIDGQLPKNSKPS